jgi:pimeloyl-ACP methyl ester carboxylesterase
VATYTSPDGVRLHYEIEGDGPALILHLGAGCDADLWRAAGYAGPLAQDFRCVLYDHRGHGASDRPGDAAANHLDRYVDDLAGLADHLGLWGVSYFGWSNAVAVGLRAAEQHPGMFGALVLFGPIAPPAPPEQLAAAVATRVTELRARGWWVLLDGMIAAEKQPVPQWMIDRILATDIEPYIGWTQARPWWDWNPWDALPHIDVPTLMIVGELEDPDDLMGEAAALMPAATRIRIPGREHINAFLASDLVLPQVREFLLR